MNITETVGCLSASFFAVAHGDDSRALTLQYAGGGLLFVICLLGWYIFLALMLLSVEFPVVLPLGNLSTIVKRFKVDKQKSSSNA